MAFATVAGMASAPFVVASRADGVQETRFEETYRGRRIVGVRHDDGRSGGGGSGTWHIAVDGRPLHLMRRADGSWVSMVDHYQSYATPLAATRAAVDELGPTAGLGAPEGAPDDTSGRTPGGDTGTKGEHRCGVHA
ncbi:tyrosinase family oxidase copper chaperone [Streptomyces xiangluensis]|uniref:Tyrosinase family oxidase copper chaperone n=1 Tax=Streptomyces xiangluensis TaxID=2665720 RepID=A0ABV8Z0K6_9ACTN